MKINKDIKTFYINLNDNSNRMEYMENLLKKYNFSNYQRFEAINTKNYENLLKNIQKYEKIFNKKIITEDTLNNLKKRKRKSHSQLPLGGVGCYLSHISIYKKIIDQNIPYALILEDDLYIGINTDIFWNKINNINIPEDTDIFLFDYNILDYVKTEIEYIDKVNFFFQTDFYLITLECAKNILNYLLPIKIQIDFKLSTLSYLNIIKVYGYNKNDLKLKQNNNYTTNIQNNTCHNCNLKKEILSFKKDNIDIINIYGTISKHVEMDSLYSSFYFYLFIIIILFYIFYKFGTRKL